MSRFAPRPYICLTQHPQLGMYQLRSPKVRPRADRLDIRGSCVDYYTTNKNNGRLMNKPDMHALVVFLWTIIQDGPERGLAHVPLGHSVAGMVKSPGVPSLAYYNIAHSYYSDHVQKDAYLQPI